MSLENSCCLMLLKVITTQEPDTAQAEIASVSAAPSFSKKLEDLAAKERERSEQKRLDFEGVKSYMYLRVYMYICMIYVFFRCLTDIIQ